MTSLDDATHTPSNTAARPSPRRAAESRAGSAAAGDKLSESAGLYRLLVERVRDYAIFALDTTGHVLSWNQGAQRLKGYSASEIIGRHFSIFYPAEDIANGKPPMELEVALREGR